MTSLPVTQKLLAGDQIDFTIDQQPYLQGFLPILELYLARASGTLSGIADVNTGPEVPRQDDGRPLQQHQEPLRGHVDRPRSRQGLGPNGREHRQPGASGAGRTSSRPSPGPSGPGPARCWCGS